MSQKLSMGQLEPVFRSTANDARLPDLVSRFKHIPFTRGIDKGFFYTVDFKTEVGLYFVRPFADRDFAPYGEVRNFESVKKAKQYHDQAMVRVRVGADTMHTILSSNHPGAVLIAEILAGKVHNDLNPVVFAANESVIGDFFKIVGEHYKEALGMSEGGYNGSRRK